MAEDSGFFRNLTGLATDWVTSKRKSLQAEEPTTNVDEYGKSGGRGNYNFDGQEISHETLRDIKEMRESGGTIASMMRYKALLHFGEGVQLSVGDNEETEQVVEGYDEPITLKDWILDNFDDLDEQLLALGEDALWYPYAAGELREDRAGGFADFLPAQPWTLVPETNAQGEIIAWHEQTRSGGHLQERTLSPEDITHLTIHKNSARDTTGISEVLRNEDEILAYKENEQAIQNAIELHGFPQRHIKVGREEGAPVRDQELRRVRTLFDPSTTDANTAYFTGQDVDVESLEAEQFDYASIHEMSVRQLTTALGLPLEVGNVGSDGLGSGKPAELRMSLLKLTIKANQRAFTRQFVDRIMRPAIRDYSPFDHEAKIELNLGDPLEDIGDMAQVIQQIGDHLTNDEIREKLDMAPHEDDEIGESYRTPADIEAPEDDSGDGLENIFNKSLQDIEDIDTTPPQGVQDAAQTALDWKEETGNPNDCGTQVGWTRASQLASGESLSEDTINRMVSYFSRHNEGGSDQPREDCSRMMWKAWGGDPGKRWAESKQSEFETARENSTGETDFRLAPSDAPEWETQLLELHQDVTNPETSMDKTLVGFTESTTPEFVKNRITEAIDDGALFSEFDEIASGNLFELRSTFKDVLTQDSWTLNELRDTLAGEFGLSTDNAEVIARTETAAALNSAREEGYKEQGLADESLFYWTGASPGDPRQTDACEWLINKTNPIAADGNPVELEELRDLVEEAPEHDDDMDNNLARPDSWTVHPNERSTYARAPETFT